MKTYLTLVLLTVLLFAGNILFAQQDKAKLKEQKKIEKQKAKEEAKKLEEEQWHELYTLFENKDIVFHGERFDGTIVIPEINFVKIYGDSAVVQFAHGIGGGQNGIGGVTVIGGIKDYKLSNKKPGKAIDLRITIMLKPGLGFRGLLNISISAFSYESAKIILNVRDGYMYGFIRSNDDASIFKGNTPNGQF